MSVAAQPGSLVPAVSVNVGNLPGNSVADRPTTTGIGIGIGGGAFGGRPSNTSPTRCSHIDLDYDPIIAVICSVYVFIGLMYAFFGKLRNIQLFVTIECNQEHNSQLSIQSTLTTRICFY